jgi:hypothetical protein
VRAAGSVDVAVAGLNAERVLYALDETTSADRRPSVQIGSRTAL